MLYEVITLLSDLLKKRLGQYDKILNGLSKAKQVDLAEKEKYEYLISKIKAFLI